MAQPVHAFKELHVRNTPTPRSNYKAFSAALGQRVKQLRKDRGWTLRDMVVTHGFHLNQVSRVESGKGISVPTLLRLAETFQISLAALVAGLREVHVVPKRSKKLKH